MRTTASCGGLKTYFSNAVPAQASFHILHLSTPLSWRGGEQQLAYLMGELRERGVTQVLLAPKGSKMADYGRREGFPLVEFKRSFSLNPLLAGLIKRTCRERRIDLIHTHDSHAHTAAVLSASLGNRTPIVVSRRVDFPLKTSGLGLWKYRHRAVKRVLCVSGFIESLVRRELPSERVTTVHSGIDPRRFERTASAASLRQEFGLSPAATLIGTVAALAPHKDLFTFLRTAKILTDRGIEAHFFIIGKDDGEGDRLKALAQQLQLTDRLSFTGFRSDVPQILPQLDIFLFTSKTEGLGTSVLDAFAAGVPVVATAAGGIVESVLHEQTGLLAPIGDAEHLAGEVQRLLADPELRTHLPAGAKEHLQQFTKSATAARTLAVYREVVEPNRS